MNKLQLELPRLLAFKVKLQDASQEVSLSCIVGPVLGKFHLKLQYDRIDIKR